MGWDKLSKVAILAVVLLAVSGCATDYVYNRDKVGPIFVKAKEPEPAPPLPVPVEEPEVIVLSVSEQNEKAVEAFGDKGFEAEISDKGIVVYLPPTIYFKGSESSIGLEARTKIAEIADEINQPYLLDRIVEISGHTDSIGDAALNLELSKQRAIAATEELIFSKVSKTRLTSLWFGESQLRFAELNDDGSINTVNRNLNRRVDFTVLNPE